MESQIRRRPTTPEDKSLYAVKCLGADARLIQSSVNKLVQQLHALQGSMEGKLNIETWPSNQTLTSQIVEGQIKSPTQNDPQRARSDPFIKKDSGTKSASLQRTNDSALIIDGSAPERRRTSCTSVFEEARSDASVSEEASPPKHLRTSQVRISVESEDSTSYIPLVDSQPLSQQLRPASPASPSGERLRPTWGTATLYPSEYSDRPEVPKALREWYQKRSTTIMTTGNRSIRMGNGNPDSSRTLGEAVSFDKVKEMYLKGVRGMKDDIITLHLHGFWEEVHTFANDAKTQNSSHGYSAYTSLVHRERLVKAGLGVAYRFGSRLEQIGIKDTGRLCRALQGLTNKIAYPHSTQHLFWDSLGLLLVMYDTIHIPFVFAWQVPFAKQGFEYWIFLYGMFFWTLDLFVNFLTGFYHKGELVLSHRRIAVRYMCTWLMIDIFLLSLDYGLAMMKESGLQMLKVIRIVRGIRVLRILKAGKLMSYIEDVCSASALQVVFLIILVIKALAFVLMSTHVLSCIWFFLGHEFGNSGWVAAYNIESATHGQQYLVSLHWVLGQFTPAPMNIVPQNFHERLFNIFVIVFSLVVMGAGVSKISSTIQRINTFNEERGQRMRQVNQYLKHQQIPVELRSRVIKFAEYKLTDTKVAKLDPALVSVSLRTEIMMNQRGPMLQNAPVFHLIKETFPDIFCDICGALQNETHEQLKTIFTAPSVAQAMYITTGTGGKFFHYERALNDIEGIYLDENGEKWKNAVNVTNVCHFAELSLYAANFRHQSKLMAAEVSHTLSLKGGDLAQCIRHHPVCSDMMYQYASSTLKLCKTKPGLVKDFLDPSFSAEACESTDLYRMIHLPLDLRIVTDSMLSIMKGNTSCRSFASMRTVTMKSMTEQPISQRSMPTVDLPDDNEWIEEHTIQLIESLQSSQAGETEDSAKGAGSEDAFHLRSAFEAAFSELDDSGIYSRMSQNEERNRILCSLICVAHLLQNRYDEFVAPQSSASRMTREVWTQLQNFVLWTRMDFDRTMIVLVFLVVRELGKAMPLVHQVPVAVETSEKALLYIVEHDTHLMPSLEMLKENRPDMFDMVRNMIVLHSHFNLLQFLQGENLPANVKTLQRMVNDCDHDILKLYLFSVLGMMCGLAASGGGTRMYGSIFMDEKNAMSLLDGVHALQHLSVADPRAIFWNYVCARSHRL